MTHPSSQPACLACNRGEAEIPLGLWRYQGREFWICPDCLPRLIHRRAELEAQLEANAAEPPAAPAHGSSEEK